MQGELWWPPGSPGPGMKNMDWNGNLGLVPMFLWPGLRTRFQPIFFVFIISSSKQAMQSFLVWSMDNATHHKRKPLRLRAWMIFTSISLTVKSLRRKQRNNKRTKGTKLRTTRVMKGASRLRWVWLREGGGASRRCVLKTKPHVWLSFAVNWRQGKSIDFLTAVALLLQPVERYEKEGWEVLVDLSGTVGVTCFVRGIRSWIPKRQLLPLLWHLSTPLTFCWYIALVLKLGPTNLSLYLWTSGYVCMLPVCIPPLCVCICSVCVVQCPFKFAGHVCRAVAWLLLILIIIYCWYWLLFFPRVGLQKAPIHTKRQKRDLPDDIFQESQESKNTVSAQCSSVNIAEVVIQQ